MALAFFVGRTRRFDPIDIHLPARLLGAIPIAQQARRGDDDQSARDASQLLVAQAFRNLRNSLLVKVGNLPAGRAHSLCILSPNRGDGRTTIAVGLAISLAKAGRRVLLVDADFQSSSIHRIFRLRQSPGLAELIEGDADPIDAVITTETAGLDVLPAGYCSVEAETLLSWKGLPDYLAALGARYDHILIDLPPLATGRDLRPLHENANGLLWVLDASRKIDSPMIEILDRIPNRF